MSATCSKIAEYPLLISCHAPFCTRIVFDGVVEPFPVILILIPLALPVDCNTTLVLLFAAGSLTASVV
ncbi:hypothetical protein DF057_28685 [Burkholderia cepacia]|nr:hypothetical protein DF057_28685 [Burkholderia cepacia]